MPVPNQFANVTTSIPLSQLDANFNTPITLGNTAIQLGNTVTTLNNMTLANVTVTSGNVTITNVTVTTANVTTANIANVIVTGTGTFAAGSNTAPSITFTGDTNTGIYSPGADQVAITTGGIQRAVVNASGNLGIGESSPAVRIQALIPSNSNANTEIFRLTDNILCDFKVLLDRKTTLGTSIARINTASGSMAFETSNAECGRFNSNGDFQITNGNVVIGTAGKGIDFSADANAATSTSELLDDYEEGDFTPTVIGTTIAGTASYTYQEGKYTKIGNFVYAKVYMVWSSGTGTGNLRFAGLPFTSANDSGFHNSGTMYIVNVAWTGSYVSHFVAKNTTQVAVYGIQNNSTAPEVPYDAAGEAQFMVVYRV